MYLIFQTSVGVKYKSALPPSGIYELASLTAQYGSSKKKLLSIQEKFILCSMFSISQHKKIGH